MVKTPELSSSLVAVKGSAAPAADMPPRAAVVQAPARPAKAPSPPTAEETSQSLNFKVTDDFKREFKSYAASHGMKLNELLQRSYETYRKQQGD